MPHCKENLPGLQPLNQHLSTCIQNEALIHTGQEDCISKAVFMYLIVIMSGLVDLNPAEGMLATGNCLCLGQPKRLFVPQSRTDVHLHSFLWQSEGGTGSHHRHSRPIPSQSSKKWKVGSHPPGSHPPNRPH